MALATPTAVQGSVFSRLAKKKGVGEEVSSEGSAPQGEEKLSSWSRIKKEQAQQTEVIKETSTEPLPIEYQVPTGYQVDPTNPDKAIPSSPRISRGGQAPPVNPEDVIDLELPNEEAYNRANTLRSQGLVPNPEEKLKFSESIVFGMVQNLEAQGQAAVMAGFMKQPTKVIDGNVYRQMDHSDGTLRWGLVNEDGLTGQDVSEVFVGEVLPTLLSFLGVVAGNAVDTARGGGKAGVVGKAAKGSAVILGDLMGTYSGYVANNLIVKKVYGLDDDALSMDTIFFGGAQEEAILGIASQVGLDATLYSVSSIYKLATGKHIPPAIVEHLSEKLDEYDGILEATIKPLQKELNKPLISPTPGQATNDPILLALEHQNAAIKMQPGEDKIVPDPYGFEETTDGLLKGVTGWFERKFTDVDPDLPLPAVENLIQQSVKKEYAVLMDDLVQKQDFATNAVQTRLDLVGGQFNNSQKFTSSLRTAADGARREVKELYDLAYTEVGATYAGLRGPSTFVTQAKKSMEAKELLILEKTLSVGADQFISKGAKVVPNQLSYEAVDATLKRLRSDIRATKRDGAMAGKPSLKSLETMQEAYTLQRLEIASQGSDGGQSISRLDTSYFTAMDAVDNDVLRRLMKPGLHGRFELGADEVMKDLFVPNTSGFKSISNEVMSKYMGILREDPIMLGDFRGAFGNRFSRDIKTPEDYKTFMDQNEGIINDLYGEVPQDMAGLKNLIDKRVDADLEVGSLITQIGADPLVKGSFTGRVKTILTEGIPENVAKLDHILSKNETLQDMFVATYLTQAIVGGTKGFPGIIQESVDGSLRFNVTSLTKLVGEVANKNSSARDVIVKKYMPEDQVAFLKTVLEVAHMHNTGANVSSVAKYDKSVAAHIAQLYMGPLAKGTRITNGADKYMQGGAARALTDVMGDPRAMRALLNKYKTPSDVYLWGRRSLFQLSARVIAGDAWKTAPTITPRVHGEEHRRPKAEETVPTEAPTEQPKPDLSGMPTNPTGEVPPFMKRVLNPSKFPVLKNEDGSVSTHMMEDAEVDGKFVAYPTIVQKASGELGKIEGDALVLAMDTGNYVEFDTQEEASKFAMGGYKDHWGKEDGSQPLSDLRVPPQAPVSPPKASSPKPKANPKGITNIPSVAPKVTAGATTGNALKAKSVMEGSSIINASKKRAAR
jgi:hypothetical protein